ncbi:MAG: HTH-type transcriptional activator RhaS [Verrucomicrobiae bacterium]|nr:HTH-type transcriptional activator RhaS [Verrucomicrobiae bacterium]
MSRMPKNSASGRETFWFAIPGLRYLGRSYTETAWPPLPPHLYPPSTMGLFFIAKGKQNFRVDQKDYLVHGGEIFVVFPNECHSSGGVAMEKNLFYWMQIDLPIVCPAPQPLPDVRRYDSVKPIGPFLYLQPSHGEALARALVNIRPRHFGGSETVWKQLSEIVAAHRVQFTPLQHTHRLTQVLNLLFEVLDCARRAAPPAISPPIREVVQHIEQNLTEPLNLPALAARAHLSASRFHGRFKAETGLPPREYIVRAKVEAAKAQLAAGASVTAVAMHFNFPTSQYFATVFKRYTGQTPTAFRQHHHST